MSSSSGSAGATEPTTTSLIRRPSIFDAVKRWHDIEGGVNSLFGGGRPAAVLLGADGMLAGGPVNGSDVVADFVQDILAELEAGALPEQVVPAPHDHADHEHADHDHEHAPHDREAEAPA